LPLCDFLAFALSARGARLTAAGGSSSAPCGAEKKL
jgi:hypothetical protein